MTDVTARLNLEEFQ